MNDTFISKDDRRFMQNLLAMNERVVANLGLSESAAQIPMDKIGATLYEDNMRRENEKVKSFWRDA